MMLLYNNVEGKYFMQVFYYDVRGSHLSQNLNDKHNLHTILLFFYLNIKYTSINRMQIENGGKVFVIEKS